jgi:hypothetical protein
MKTKLLALIVICSVLPNFTAQWNFYGQRIKRDLAKYETAGPYDFHNELHPRDAEKLRQDMRDFLWKHWSEPRFGLVAATFYTLEGDPTKSHYFVESDEKGTWRIRVESEKTLSSLLPKGKRPKRVIAYDDYDDVKRVEASTLGTADAIFIPSDEVRSPETYKLYLRDTQNKSVILF